MWPRAIINGKQATSPSAMSTALYRPIEWVSECLPPAKNTVMASSNDTVGVMNNCTIVITDAMSPVGAMASVIQTVYMIWQTQMPTTLYRPVDWSLSLRDPAPQNALYITRNETLRNAFRD